MEIGCEVLVRLPNMIVSKHECTRNIAAARWKYSYILTKHSLFQEGTKLYSALPTRNSELPYSGLKTTLKDFLIKKVSPNHRKILRFSA